LQKENSVRILLGMLACGLVWGTTEIGEGEMKIRRSRQDSWHASYVREIPPLEVATANFAGRIWRRLFLLVSTGKKAIADSSKIQLLGKPGRILLNFALGVVRP